MTTLIEFLEARLAEDEAAALAAGSARWAFKEIDWHDFSRWTVEDEEDETIVFRDVNGAHYAAVHAARHDPARVLREVQAKRAILELHGRSHECSTYDHHGDIESCSWCLNPEDCSTLLALAAIYSDHEAYRKEWAT